MMAQWMVRAVLVAGGLGAAAWLAEVGAEPFRLPRRWIWHGAMVVSVLLPLVAPVMPRITGADALVGRLVLAVTQLPRPLASSDGPVHRLGGDALLGGLWVVSSVLALAVLLVTQRRLHSARASWVRARIDGVAVLVAPDVGPAVVGIVTPTIVLPAWVVFAPVEERRLITVHEQAHVRAGDSRLLGSAALIVAAMPWNPMLWWLYRRLRRAVEIDCDARTLALGADVRRYGHMLVTAAGRSPSFSLHPAFTDRHSFLTSRIRAMTETVPSRVRYVRAAACGLAAVVALAAACSSDASRLPTAPTGVAAHWNVATASSPNAAPRCVLMSDRAGGMKVAGLDEATIRATRAAHPDWTCALPGTTFTVTSNLGPLTLEAVDPVRTSDGIRILKVPSTPMAR